MLDGHFRPHVPEVSHVSPASPCSIIVNTIHIGRARPCSCRLANIRISCQDRQRDRGFLLNRWPVPCSMLISMENCPMTLVDHHSNLIERYRDPVNALLISRALDSENSSMKMNSPRNWCLLVRSYSNWSLNGLWKTERWKIAARSRGIHRQENEEAQ